MRHTDTVHTATATSSIALYVLSLPLPAVYAGGDSGRGLTALFFGIFGLGEGTFAWFANPSYWLALIFFLRRHYGAAALFSLIGIAIGLDSFRAEKWWFNEGSGTPIDSLGPAFYVWELSMVALLVGAICRNLPGGKA